MAWFTRDRRSHGGMEKAALTASVKAVRRMMGPLSRHRGFPFGVHRDAPLVYAAGYLLIRDVYMSDGIALTRSERELVATAVSTGNECEFCAQSHGVLLAIDARDARDAVRARALDQIADPRQRLLAEIGLRSKDPTAPMVKAPPLTREEASDVVVTMSLFHYINRVMDALGPLGATRTFIANPPPPILARILSYHWPAPRGEALERLRKAGVAPPLEIDPADRAEMDRWALGDERVSDALALAWSLIQHTARGELDEAVLNGIRDHIRAWNGEDAPLTGPWLDEAVEGFTGRDEPRAQLRQGILVARAAYRIDRHALADACGGSARRRVALVSFAAFAASLRICSWVSIPAHRA